MPRTARRRSRSRSSRRTRLITAVVTALVLVVIAAVSGHWSLPGSGSGGADGPAPAWTMPADPSRTETELASLPVKGKAPKTGYSRDQFGEGWTDTDHNGCDTRNDVLGRDLKNVAFRDARDCKVRTGTLQDPYTGRSIDFTAGGKSSSAVQIDHVVALSDAWQTGAQQISREQREDLANDPTNLLAVDGPTNNNKSDGDAATWLPPNAGFRCEYVTRQVQVKKKYGLWVTAAERDAIGQVLKGC